MILRGFIVFFSGIVFAANLTALGYFNPMYEGSAWKASFAVIVGIVFSLMKDGKP